MRRVSRAGSSSAERRLRASETSSSTSSGESARSSCSTTRVRSLTSRKRAIPPELCSHAEHRRQKPSECSREWCSQPVQQRKEGGRQTWKRSGFSRMTALATNAASMSVTGTLRRWHRSAISNTIFWISSILTNLSHRPISFPRYPTTRSVGRVLAARVLKRSRYHPIPTQLAENPDPRKSRFGVSFGGS